MRVLIGSESSRAINTLITPDTSQDSRDPEEVGTGPATGSTELEQTGQLTAGAVWTCS